MRIHEGWFRTMERDCRDQIQEAYREGAESGREW